MGIWDEMKKEYKKEKEKIEVKEREKAAEAKPTETEKLAKAGNTILKGVALWYLIPFFTIVAIVGLFAVAWIWDVITGLF